MCAVMPTCFVTETGSRSVSESRSESRYAGNDGRVTEYGHSPWQVSLRKWFPEALSDLLRQKRLRQHWISQLLESGVELQREG